MGDRTTETGQNPVEDLTSSVLTPMIPILVLGGMIIVACITVCLRITLKTVAPYLLVAAGLSLVYGARLYCRTRDYTVFAVISTIVILTVLFQTHRFSPDCSFDNIVSTTPDAWSYSAFGKYLWENKRGSDSGLPLIDQYASHLSNTRFAAASLLALLSVFSRWGDPSSTMLLFFAVCSGCFSLAVYCLSKALGLSEAVARLSALLSATVGWIPIVFEIGNLDHLVFMSFLASTVAIVVAITRQPDLTANFLIGLILCFSASFFIYPEGLAIGAIPLVGLIGLLLYRLYIHRRLILLLGGTAISLAIVAPYLPIATQFFLQQIATTRVIARPGMGAYAGLLRPVAFLPGVFALGEEYPGSDVSLLNLVVPLFVLGLIAIGARQLKGYLWLIVIVIAACIFSICYQIWDGYDYGLYKVLSINSYLLFPLAASGINTIIASIHWGRRIPIWLGGLVLIAATAAEVYEDTWYRVKLGCVEETAQLRGLTFVARERVVTVSVDEAFSQLWAVYFLRDIPLRLPYPMSYFAMSHVSPLLVRARAFSRDSMGTLILGQDDRAIWSNGAFSLIPNRVAKMSGAEITAVINPNGVETLEGVRFIWVGTQPITFLVTVEKPGDYVLRAGKFLMGPSLPGIMKRRVEIEIGSHKTEVTVDQDTHEIPLRLPRGNLEIKMSCLDKPTVLRQASGDPRPLLLGVQRFWIEEAESSVR